MRLKSETFDFSSFSNFQDSQYSKLLQGGPFDGTGHFSRCTLFFSKFSLVPSRQPFSEIKSRNFPVVPSRRPFSEKKYLSKYYQNLPVFVPKITQIFSFFPNIPKFPCFLSNFTVFIKIISIKLKVP